MTTSQFERLDEFVAELVLRWRYRKLSEAGHDPTAALFLASQAGVDLQLASDLLSVAAGARRAASSAA